MNDILNNLGLFTKEESNDYLKHMIAIQTIARDSQIFVLFIIMMAIDDQPTLNSFRSCIGKLLMKKIYVMKTKEDSGYSKVIDNALDLRANLPASVAPLCWSSLCLRCPV